MSINRLWLNIIQFDYIKIFKYYSCQKYLFFLIRKIKFINSQNINIKVANPKVFDSATRTTIHQNQKEKPQAKHEH